MALKVDYFMPEHWQQVLRWRGSEAPYPKHAFSALEDGALVAVLAWELGDGALMVLTSLDVNPAILEADRQEAARYVSLAALQNAKMNGKVACWVGPALQKAAPRKPGVADGGLDGTSTKRDEGDVTQEPEDVNSGEELDW